VETMLKSESFESLISISGSKVMPPPKKKQLTFELETLESQSKAQKTHVIA